MGWWGDVEAQQILPTEVRRGGVEGQLAEALIPMIDILLFSVKFGSGLAGESGLTCGKKE